MIKLVVMMVAAAAALAPAAALGQNDWTGIIGSGRPGDSNWAAEAPTGWRPAWRSASRRPRPLRGPSGARQIISTRAGEAGPIA